ncbi:MAG: hypothetical protein KDC53_22585 [Saprospiraceae bacterium]|nr:hypothetical protein [Saprospiraceae bacterium]
MKADFFHCVGTLLPYVLLFVSINGTDILAQSVLFEAGVEDTIVDPPASGPGVRFMWFPQRIALRSGKVASDQWDKDHIGIGSVVWGQSSIASGQYATAWGKDNISEGELSTSWGADNLALGNISTSFGQSNISRGDVSNTMGFGLIANSYVETVIGRFNDTLETSNPTMADDADYLFVVGNGSSGNFRSNALELYKNGHTRIKSLVFYDDTLSVNHDNTVINVDVFGYLRLGATPSSNPDERTVILADGSYPGQMVILQCIANTFQMLDDTSNTNLSSNHNLGISDTITLIWDGNIWLETHYSDN